MLSQEIQLRDSELFTQVKTRLRGCDSYLQLLEGMSCATKFQRAELGLETTGKQILPSQHKNLLEIKPV